MFYSTIPPEQLVEQINELKKKNEELRASNLYLTKLVEQLENKVGLSGLTNEELQSVHGLINMQIKLISELQSQVESDTDVIDLANPINALASLVSLVSKPTG